MNSTCSKVCSNTVSSHAPKVGIERPEEPHAASSIEPSTHFIILAASVAMRPYSCAVLASICHGPSISLPRHQNLTAETPELDTVRLLPAVRAPAIRQLGATGVVTVFDQSAGRIAAAGPKVHRQHRLDIRGAAPVDKLVCAELVCLGRHPREIEPPRALRYRAYAVFPVVSR